MVASLILAARTLILFRLASIILHCGIFVEYQLHHITAHHFGHPQSTKKLLTKHLDKQTNGAPPPVWLEIRSARTDELVVLSEPDTLAGRVCRLIAPAMSTV